MKTAAFGQTSDPCILHLQIVAYLDFIRSINIQAKASKIRTVQQGMFRMNFNTGKRPSQNQFQDYPAGFRILQSRRK